MAEENGNLLPAGAPAGGFAEDRPNPGPSGDRSTLGPVRADDRTGARSRPAGAGAGPVQHGMAVVPGLEVYAGDGPAARPGLAGPGDYRGGRRPARRLERAGGGGPAGGGPADLSLGPGDAGRPDLSAQRPRPRGAGLGRPDGPAHRGLLDPLAGGTVAAATRPGTG